MAFVYVEFRRMQKIQIYTIWWWILDVTVELCVPPQIPISIVHTHWALTLLSATLTFDKRRHNILDYWYGNCLFWYLLNTCKARTCGFWHVKWPRNILGVLIFMGQRPLIGSPIDVNERRFAEAVVINQYSPLPLRHFYFYSSYGHTRWILRSYSKDVNEITLQWNKYERPNLIRIGSTCENNYNNSAN